MGFIYKLGSKSWLLLLESVTILQPWGLGHARKDLLYFIGKMEDYAQDLRVASLTSKEALFANGDGWLCQDPLCKALKEPRRHPLENYMIQAANPSGMGIKLFPVE